MKAISILAIVFFICVLGCVNPQPPPKYAAGDMIIVKLNGKTGQVLGYAGGACVVRLSDDYGHVYMEYFKDFEIQGVLK